MIELIDKKRCGPRLNTIETGHQNQRIDNYLMSVLKGVPKSHLYKLLRTGQVRVNKGRIKPTYRLKLGDIVRIPPITLAPKDKPRKPDESLCDELENAILYEDEDLLIVNKPAGIAVHGGSGISSGAIDVLRYIRPDIPDLALVHRLDRYTSGCLMLAKNRNTLIDLHALLKNAQIEKYYLALLKDPIAQTEINIEASLQKNRLQSGERMVSVDEHGKTALTSFTAKEIFRQASLVKVRIFTGRTHQIRVHATHMGHPVAGDPKYGDRQFNRDMKKLGLRRLFLHAHSLKFQLSPGINKKAGKKISVSAPLPDDLRQLLDKLRIN